jgi:predicted Zn-dependent peptidase
MTKLKKYQNGLTLIVLEEQALSVTFAIMVNAGCINETAKNNGISHFVEHVNFKGTKNLTSFDISNKLEFLGSQYNAYTGMDVTCYHAQSLPENTEKTFEIFADMVFNSTYLDEETSKEKGVILEEIKMSNDTPDDVCFDLASTAFFGSDGYGMTILGSEENVKSFKKQDFLNYLKDFYVAENIVVTFAGNLTKDFAESLVEKYVLPFVKEGKSAKTPDHNVINKRDALVKIKDIEQAHFCLSFPSVSYVNEDKIKSEMAVSILGGGMSSRLFMKIREELSLAYSVYSFASRFKDVGLVSIYAGVNALKVDDAFGAIIDTIKEVNKNGVTEEEFNKVKNQIKSSTIFALERPSAKVQLLSKYYLLTGKLYDYYERINATDKITKKDVEEKMKEFDVYNMSTAIVGKNVKPLKI